MGQKYANINSQNTTYNINKLEKKYFQSYVRLRTDLDIKKLLRN